MTARVVVVDLGRGSALGASRRVTSWNSLWTAAGATVEVVRLVEDCPTRRAVLIPALVSAVLRPTVVAETALWSRRALGARLRAARPDVVVYVTARSWAPGLVPDGAVAVMDYVDQLSENYAQRARAAAPLRALAFRLLAAQMRRFERRALPVVARTAAGRADAAALGAQWVPNLVTLPPPSSRQPDTDLLFVGTLDYEPNVNAVHRLLRLWPRVQALRPGTTMLVAGAHPSRALIEQVRGAGWLLEADFATLTDVCGRARLAVAPLAIGTGIQNKVLEAAAHGLAQVVDPHVLRGVEPDFPAACGRDDEQLVQEIVRLLDAPDERADLARRGRLAVEDGYTAGAWAHWGHELLGRVA